MIKTRAASIGPFREELNSKDLAAMVNSFFELGFSVMRLCVGSIAAQQSMFAMIKFLLKTECRWRR